MKKMTYLLISAVILSGLCTPKVTTSVNATEDSNNQGKTNEQQKFSEVKIPLSSSIENLDSFSDGFPTDSTTSRTEIPTKDSNTFVGIEKKKWS